MLFDTGPGPSKRRAEETNFAENLSAAKRKRVEQDPGLVYAKMVKFLATKNQLDLNGFPRPGKSYGKAEFRCSLPRQKCRDTERKVCVRCNKKFILWSSGVMEKEEECVYHSRVCFDFVWQCCLEDYRHNGCRTSKTHVHDDNKNTTKGYEITTWKSFLWHKEFPGIYAVDCEMSFTADGRELTRVSIVDHEYKIVLDTYVKPYGQILCYNTEYSGVTEEKLREVKTTLADVQRFILDKFSSDTIVIGHSLENDLVALRLVHEKVVDTSLVFPHPREQRKYALRTLAKRWLGKTIQTGAHDSVEDATTCMQLMMTKLAQEEQKKLTLAPYII